MTTQDHGDPAAPAGLSPSVEPLRVSPAPAASIPIAEPTGAMMGAGVRAFLNGVGHAAAGEPSETLQTICDWADPIVIEIYYAMMAERPPDLSSVSISIADESPVAEGDAP